MSRSTSRNTSRTTPTSYPRAGLKEWLALAVLSLAVILLAVDATVLSLAIPSLTEELAPTSTQILWIGDIYSFALAGLLVTMGNVADRIGRKRLLLIGAMGFGVSSALAAFAPSPEMLIAARALLGVSGATLLPSTLAIVRNIFHDPRQRTTAIAVWAAGFTGGSALGPLVGGVLLEHFWWGSVFLINIPVMVVLLVSGIFLLPESRNPDRAPLDFLSSALSILAIVPIVFSLKTLVDDGVTIAVVVSLLVGVLAGYLFVRRQRRLDHPMIDVTLFRQPAFTGALVANAMALFAFVGLLFFFSQYLQLVRGFGPLQAGIAELPLSIPSILIAVAVTAIVVRIGRGRAIGAGLLTGAVGLGVVAVAEGLPGYVWLGAGLAVVGVGVGLGTTVAVDAVVASVPKERAGAASAISETAAELGVALGIAVLGSLLGLFYRTSLVLPAGTSDALAAAAEDSLAAATAATAASPGADGGAEVLEAAQHAFALAMQYTSVLAAVLLAISGVIAWRLVPSRRDESMQEGVVEDAVEGTR